MQCEIAVDILNITDICEQMIVTLLSLLCHDVSVYHAHDIRVEAWDWAEFCITWPTLDWSAILSRDPLLFPIGAGRSQSGAKKRESKWRKYLIIWIGTELKGSNIWNFISDSGMHWDKRFVYFVTSSQSSWTPATIKWCEIWLKIVLRLTSPPQ